MDIKIALGSIFSAAWIGGLAYVSYSRWDILQGLPLNSLGDFLAGALSPLAFLWLVLGYLQNTAALKIQGEELKQAVLEYRQLNKTNSDHMQFLEDERAARVAAERKAKRMHLVQMDGHQLAVGTTPTGYRFLLKNIGNEALNVLFLSTVEYLNLDPTRTIVIESGGALELSAYTDVWTPRSGNIAITYTNGLGEPELLRVGLFILADQTMLVGLNQAEINALSDAFPA